MQGSLLLINTPTARLYCRFLAISLFWQLSLYLSQTVILRCWTCLNLNCLKVITQNIFFWTWLTHEIIFSRFTTISSHFSTTNFVSFTELKLRRSFEAQKLWYKRQMGMVTNRQWFFLLFSRDYLLSTVDIQTKVILLVFYEKKHKNMRRSLITLK